MRDWTSPQEAGSHRVEVRDPGAGWGVYDLRLDGEVVFRASSRRDAERRAELLAQALDPHHLPEDTPWSRHQGVLARTFHGCLLEVEAEGLAVRVNGRALRAEPPPASLAQAKRLAEREAQGG